MYLHTSRHWIDFANTLSLYFTSRCRIQSSIFNLEQSESSFVMELVSIGQAKDYPFGYSISICLENICPLGSWLPSDMPQSLHLCRSEAKACLVWDILHLPLLKLIHVQHRLLIFLNSCLTENNLDLIKQNHAQSSWFTACYLRSGSLLKCRNWV